MTQTMPGMPDAKVENSLRGHALLKFATSIPG